MIDWSVLQAVGSFSGLSLQSCSETFNEPFLMIVKTRKRDQAFDLVFLNEYRGLALTKLE